MFCDLVFLSVVCSWELVRPRALVVEDGSFDIENPSASPMHAFLCEQGMRWFAKLYNSLIYLTPGAFRGR